MFELRFHGRGGQGTVEACQLLAKAIIREGGYAQFIPSFGVERKGSPVYGFFRIDDKPIRPKTQVYFPNAVIILDDTLINNINVFEGIQKSSTIVVNTKKALDELNIPSIVNRIGTVDAFTIAHNIIGVDIPNTVMLGALDKVLNLVPSESLLRVINDRFGEKNAKAYKKGFDSVIFYEKNEEKRRRYF